MMLGLWPSLRHYRGINSRRIFMLTSIRVKNFKRLIQAEFELGSAVVFVGPNNSGKTTALQAITLWHLALQTWVSEKGSRSRARKRTGITLSRRDLLSLPVPDTKLLWHDMHVRRGSKDPNGQSITFEIELAGVLAEQPWSLGFEFDYANPESFHCRPIGEIDDAKIRLLENVAESLSLAFLGPMSGLAAVEAKIEAGRIDVLIGEGQTAQILRNLCFSVYEKYPGPDGAWAKIQTEMKRLFGISLEIPIHDRVRGELSLSYKNERNVSLDISTSGRGLQQTLLLLSFLYAKPGSALLLDEPDAHLEILRQRQIYNLIKETADSTGGQVICASHSEIVLDEAAGRDTVIAFLGQPHRINGQTSQLRKSLASIGYSKYLQAEQIGWILQVEGSTDLSILMTLSKRLSHPSFKSLSMPFVDFVDCNQPNKARETFYGLLEARPDLLGISIFDRLGSDAQLKFEHNLKQVMWKRREIENYVCTRKSLILWARGVIRDDDLLDMAQAEKRILIMTECIDELFAAMMVARRDDPFGPDCKVSDEFLDPLFANYFQKLGEPVEQMRKKDYHRLAEFIPIDEIDAEVGEKLSLIAEVAAMARSVK